MTSTSLQMAVDTIFLCFCEDSDRNDGVERPYYMSTGLMVREINYSFVQGCVEL